MLLGFVNSRPCERKMNESFFYCFFFLGGGGGGAVTLQLVCFPVNFLYEETPAIRTSPFIMSLALYGPSYIMYVIILFP